MQPDVSAYGLGVGAGVTVIIVEVPVPTTPVVGETGDGGATGFVVGGNVVPGG